jgi:hypothetical protein
MLQRLSEIISEFHAAIEQVDHGGAFGILVEWACAVDEELRGIIAAVIRHDVKLEGTPDAFAGEIGGPGVIVQIRLDVVLEIPKRLTVGVAERLQIEIDPRIEFLRYHSMMSDEE